MTRYLTDHGTATWVWLISVLLSSLLPITSPSLHLVMFGVQCLTTINLLHARYALYSHGQRFLDRVRAVLHDDYEHYAGRMSEVERIVADVKEAQILIAGQFRGRSSQHP